MSESWKTERADFFLAKPGPEIVTNIEKKTICTKHSFWNRGFHNFWKIWSNSPKETFSRPGNSKGIGEGGFIKNMFELSSLNLFSWYTQIHSHQKEPEKKGFARWKQLNVSLEGTF